MTIGEFKAKEKGFLEFQEIKQVQNENLGWWQSQVSAGFAWGGKDFDIQKMWESRPSNYKNRAETTDEELVEIAEEKGIISPTKV